MLLFINLIFDIIIIYISSDVDMVIKIENSVRGGMSYVRERYMKTTHDEQLLLLDANGLYGHAQSMPLPEGDYVELDEEDANAIDWKTQQMDQEYGYCVTVGMCVGIYIIFKIFVFYFILDVVYPPHLHDLHEQFPVAVDSMDINYDMLSQYAKKTLQQTSLPGTAKHYKAKKLIGSYSSKKNYTVHYMNLRLYMELGLQITKIHSAIRFKQSRHLQEYIEFCMDKRKNAKSKFEKNIWKLLINGCFGKFKII